MIDALRVIRYGLKDLWEEFISLVVLNLLWTLTATLPLIPLLALNSLSLVWGLAASLLLALPLPIVTGALCFVTNQVSRGKIPGWGIFVTGLRRYWTKSLTVALINLVVLVLIGANLQFYGLILQGTWTNYAFGAWLIVALYWLLTQVFWFPMILELENEKVLLALRNALAMVVITPGFTLALGALMLVLAALCIALSVPLVLIMASLLLLIANHATRSRLAFIQKKPYPPVPDEDGNT
jgi:hypothetical protein